MIIYGGSVWPPKISRDYFRRPQVTAEINNFRVFFEKSKKRQIHQQYNHNKMTETLNTELHTEYHASSQPHCSLPKWFTVHK
jgi:hypothetical protein